MILTIVLAVITLLIAGTAFYFLVMDEPDKPSSKPLWYAAGFFLLVTVISSGFRIIPAGYVGVVTWLGEVEDRTLQPGAQFVVPLFEGITEVETRVHGIHFEDVGAASREYQDVFLAGTLNVHVDSDGVGDLYQRVGLDYADKLINPFFNDIIKEVVPNYAIGDILAKRGEIRALTVQALNTKLNPYHITVDDVAIANISFSDAYTKAIEDKQVQAQKVQTEQQILEQKRIQAQQNVVVAQGQAQAAIEAAKGQAEANRLLTESLSDDLIRYTAITKLSDKINIALVPSNGGLILDIGSLTNPTPAP